MTFKMHEWDEEYGDFEYDLNDENVKAISKTIREEIDKGIMQVMLVMGAESVEEQAKNIRRLLKENPELVKHIEGHAPFPKEAKAIIDFDEL